MENPKKQSEQFEKDCVYWRGRQLTGDYAHWCPNWDGLPIDETTIEWPCGCIFTEAPKETA